MQSFFDSLTDCGRSAFSASGAEYYINETEKISSSSQHGDSRSVDIVTEEEDIKNVALDLDN